MEPGLGTPFPEFPGKPPEMMTLLLVQQKDGIPTKRTMKYNAWEGGDAGFFIGGHGRLPFEVHGSLPRPMRVLPLVELFLLCLLLGEVTVMCSG